jgi:uncharacterized protein with PQ loop repeat
MVDVFGFCATIVSLVIILIGLPAQIYKNYKRRSVEGLSKTLFTGTVFSYLFWCLYAWTKGDAYLAWSQTPGLVLVCVLFSQFFLYGKRAERRNKALERMRELESLNKERGENSFRNAEISRLKLTL